MRDRANFCEKIVARKKKRKRRRRRRWRKKRDTGSRGSETGDNEGTHEGASLVDSSRKFEAAPAASLVSRREGHYDIWPKITSFSGDEEIGNAPAGNEVEDSPSELESSYRFVLSRERSRDFDISSEFEDLSIGNSSSSGNEIEESRESREQVAKKIGILKSEIVESASISKARGADEFEKKTIDETLTSSEFSALDENGSKLEEAENEDENEGDSIDCSEKEVCRDGEEEARRCRRLEKLGKFGKNLDRVVVKSANFVSTLVTIVLTVSLFIVATLGHENSHVPVDNIAGIAEAFAGGPVKYSTRIVRTRYGTLRGIVTRDNDLEAYLGVPYATPPLGALRYMPPVTPTQWRGVKHADSMPPVCPQRKYDFIDSSSGTRPDDFLPFVRSNQSEDCLYLNLYVPRSNRGNGTELLPALLLVHGESYSWGEGNSLVGTALASHGRLVVVSINFRLGILGFLKTGSKGSGQGNYGLMDLVAGLHWLRENLEAFGGDPQRLSVLGHGTGAALANFLAVSPMAKELIERVVLLGGSALSPWAIQRDPLAVKRRVAEQTGCPSDVEADDIAACLRLRSLDQLLQVRLDSPRFTAGFAPFVDGTVLPLTSGGNIQPTVGSSGLYPIAPGPGVEFASFGNRHLLMGLTSDEAWLDLSDEDIRNGLNETRRDRILRTYVRNTYRYHLHEIYSTLRNEYTDWERGEQSPAGIREALLALLGDGQVAAPLLRLALLHSASGSRGYFLHFQPGDRPSRKGEELPYLLGIPMLRNEAANSPSIAPLSGNYTTNDEHLSRLLVRYLANFIWRGDPNDNAPDSPPFWDVYDSINQYYLEVEATTTKMRSHYRGHKMSLWLNLLPQLHRPGYEISMRHHHLSESPSLYEGAVRPQTMVMPIPAPPLTIPSPTEASMSPLPVLTTECAPNEIGPSTPRTASTSAGISDDDIDSRLGPGPNNLLRKFASNHYQSYTTALTVTIAVGIFLLLLNILIFAGIYHQRDRNAAAAAATSGSSYRIGKKEDSLEAGCSGLDLPPSKSRLSASLVNSDSPPMSSSPPIHKQKLVQQLELELQEFQCSPPPGGTIGGTGKRISTIDPPNYGWPDPPRTPSPCVDVAAGNNADEDDDNDDDDDDDDDDDAEDDDDDDDDEDDLEENLPEPPPPPKAPAPNVAACPGILRQPGTPGSAKKRVQIQEISV